MAKSLTADDILPLVACLTPQERLRLLRLIGTGQVNERDLYKALPAARDEFSSEEEPLLWDAEGWENVG
jgi:hypothetical protein